MKRKSILMPHTCQKIGWWLLILSIVVELATMLFVHKIDEALPFAKASHIIFILSIFLICMSKEKVEDEMISGFRLKSIGIISYVFFVLLLILSIVLNERFGFLFLNIPGTLSAYLSEIILIVLPILLFVLYYGVFKLMILKSKKEYAL